MSCSDAMSCSVSATIRATTATIRAPTVREWIASPPVHSGQGSFAVQQVQDIAVPIREECQGVPVGGLRIGEKVHAHFLQPGVHGGEMGVHFLTDAQTTNG